MSLSQEIKSIKSFIQNQEVATVKNHLDLRKGEFMIEGFPHIFSHKLDYKELFRQWGYEPPGRISKQNKIELLKLTRDRHSPDTLNWKYWNTILEELNGGKITESIKLF